jgi:hypothetical protein
MHTYDTHTYKQGGAPGEATQNIRVALSDNEEDTDEEGEEEGEEEEVPLEAAKLKEMEKNALGIFFFPFVFPLSSASPPTFLSRSPTLMYMIAYVHIYGQG